MRKLEISICRDGKEIYSNDDLLKLNLKKSSNINKKSKIKAYNFSIFALALVDLNLLAVDDRLKMTESGAKLLGFGGKMQFMVFIGLMFLTACLEPMLNIIKSNKKETRNSVLDRWGYTQKMKEESLLKDALIIAVCVLMLFLPFILF